jgi:hypothetical protein
VDRIGNDGGAVGPEAASNLEDSKAEVKKKGRF